MDLLPYLLLTCALIVIGDSLHGPFWTETRAMGGSTKFMTRLNLVLTTIIGMTNVLLILSQAAAYFGFHLSVFSIYLEITYAQVAAVIQSIYIPVLITLFVDCILGVIVLYLVRSYIITKHGSRQEYYQSDEFQQASHHSGHDVVIVNNWWPIAHSNHTSLTDRVTYRTSSSSSTNRSSSSGNTHRSTDLGATYRNSPVIPVPVVIGSSSSSASLGSTHRSSGSSSSSSSGKKSGGSSSSGAGGIGMLLLLLLKVLVWILLALAVLLVLAMSAFISFKANRALIDFWDEQVVLDAFRPEVSS